MRSIKARRFSALIALLAECGDRPEQFITDVLVTKYNVMSMEAFLYLIDLKARKIGEKEAAGG